MKEVLVALLKKLSSILEVLGKSVFSELLSHKNGIATLSNADLEANLEILKMTGHVLSISMQRITSQKQSLMRVFLENTILLNFFADVIAFDFSDAMGISTSTSHHGISLIAIDLSKTS